ncbi:MAG: hypothetical protein ACE5HE_00505 [Phycisphaerae bacterium]
MKEGGSIPENDAGEDDHARLFGAATAPGAGMIKHPSNGEP